MKLNQHTFSTVKNHIYNEGRLLERRMFELVFGDGTPEEFLSALRAYMNNDGGFGNGIEPDLRTPKSNAISVETALCLIDIANVHDGTIVREIAHWVSRSLNQNGWISHPVDEIKKYPHQPWWENTDDKRILSISGLLNKLGVESILDEERIRQYALTLDLPEEINIYDYPLFVYALYHHDFERRDEILDHYKQGMEVFLKNNMSHYPLFSRYWYHAIETLPNSVVEAEAWRVIDGLTTEGHLVNMYDDLPWWTPIFTLDALAIQKKYGFLKIID